MAAGLLVLAGCRDETSRKVTTVNIQSAIPDDSDRAANGVPAATTLPVAPSAAPTITVKQVPGPADEQAVGSDILIKALGTEPFWAVNVMLGRLTYSTPESPGWTLVTTELSEEGDRLRYTGKLGGKDFILVISKGTCSDGMSDTVYPLTAKLTIGAEIRQGCAKAT